MITRPNGSWIVRTIFLLFVGATISHAYFTDDSEVSEPPMRIAIPRFTVSLSPTSRDFTDAEKDLIWDMVNTIFTSTIPDKVGSGITFEFMRLATVGNRQRRHRRQLTDWSRASVWSDMEDGVTKIQFPGVVASFRGSGPSQDRPTANKVNEWAKECLESKLPEQISSELSDFSDIDSAEYKSSGTFGRTVHTDITFPGSGDIGTSTTTSQAVQSHPDSIFLNIVNKPWAIGSAVGAVVAALVAVFLCVFLVRRKGPRVGIATPRELKKMDKKMVKEVMKTNQELSLSQDNDTENGDDSTVDSVSRMNKYMSLMHVVRTESFEKDRPAQVKKSMMIMPWSSGKTSDNGMVGATTDDVYPSQVMISDSVLQPSYFLSNEEGSKSYSEQSDGSSGDWTSKASFNGERDWDPDEVDTSQSEEMMPPFMLEQREEELEKERNSKNLTPPSQVRKSRFFL